MTDPTLKKLQKKDFIALYRQVELNILKAENDFETAILRLRDEKKRVYDEKAVTASEYRFHGLIQQYEQEIKNLAFLLRELRGTLKVARLKAKNE